MPVTQRSIEAFIARLQTCMTVEALFTALEHEIAQHGCQDVLFAHVSGNPPKLEVTFSATQPDEGVLQSLRSRCACSAGEGADSPSSSLSWIEPLLRSAPGGRAQLRKTKPVADPSLMTVTIPFYGPGDDYDVVNLIMREGCDQDPKHLAIVKLKAFAAIERYEALRASTGDATSSLSLSEVGHREPCVQTRACPVQVDSPSTDAKHADCWALALVDIAWRRYSAGLLSLNERVMEIIGKTAMSEYLARGLIQEEPDDLRFNYVFKPTSEGERCLRTCPCVSRWRAQVWSDYVEVHERPAD
ncbi:MAG: hypothetical protein AB7S74_00665 [Hyphomicrobium sp.]